MTQAQGTCDEIIIEAEPVCNAIGNTFDINYTISGNAIGPFTIMESSGGASQSGLSATGTISGLTYVNQNNKVTLTITDEASNCMTTYDVLQLNCTDQTVCDCSTPDLPFSINVQASGNGNGFSMVYALVDPSTGQISQINQTGAFGSFPDNIVWDVYAFNVSDLELMAFTTALQQSTGIGDATTDPPSTAFETFCYTFQTTTLAANCNCPTICEDIVIDATTICDTGGGSYSIVINSITGGDGVVGNYIVTIGGTDFIYPTDFPLSGQVYSGDDQSSVLLNIQDADDASCTTTFEVFELNCVDQTMCNCTLDDPLTISVQASGNANGHSMVYVLVDPSGTVVSANGSGMFGDLLGDGSMYTVIAVNYDDTDELALLGDIDALISNGLGAGDLLTPAGSFLNYCYEAFTAEIGEDCMCCDISDVVAEVSECNDNNTGGTGTDDTFNFTLSVTNQTTPNTGFQFDGTALGLTMMEIGTYGPNGYSSGNLPIGSLGGTTVTITVIDQVDPNCTFDVDIAVPEPCSCEITPTVANLECNDNGTPSDQTDDTFTFQVMVNGSSSFPNATQMFTDNLGNGGNYGDILDYVIDFSDGFVDIVYTDVDNPDCTITIRVNAPQPCVFECSITPTVTIFECDDNGSPDDPDDDRFMFEVTVNGTSNFPGTPQAFTDNLGNSGIYGATINYGYFPIAGGPITITYNDANDPFCQTTIDINPPPTCSDFMCTDIIVDATTICEGIDGTYTIVINSITGGDGVAGDYIVNIGGMDYTFPTDFPLAGQAYSGGNQGTVLLEISDADNGTCTTTFEVFELNCIEQTTCNCGNDPNDLTINVQASGEANGFDMHYVLVDVNGIVLDANASGSFANLIGDGRSYEIIAINYESSDAMIISDIQNLIDSPIAPLLTNTSPFDAYCFTTASTTLSPNCVCCDISGADIQVLDCNDEGTPGDPADDTFGFTLNVTQSVVDGQNNGFVFDGSALGLSMSESGVYGPNGYSVSGILIGANAGNTVTITLVDVDNSLCTFDVDITIPLTCSEAICEITPVVTSTAVCDDKGTPGIPSDDTFTFVITVNGSSTFPGASGVFMDNFGNSGFYGTNVVYQFDISDDFVDITFTDTDNPDCTAMIRVDAPDTCSDAMCVIEPMPPSNVMCNDNGTPGDPSDDTFTFDVVVNGDSTFPNASDTFIDDQGSMPMAYGSTVSYGPFNIATGNFTINYSDGDGNPCMASIDVVAPSTCSGATCEINPVVTSNPVCDDNGTPDDPTDDTFIVEVTIQGVSTFPNATNTFFDSESNVGVNYGQTIQYQFPISGGNIMLTYTDSEESGCTESIVIMAPSTCSDQPPCEDILVEAFSECENDGTFTVVISSITGGTMSGTFNVTVANETQLYSGAQLFFTDLLYSNGPTQGTVTISIEDASLSSCSTTFEVFELNCVDQTTCDCTNDPNDLTINVQASGEANGFQMYYVLVDENGNVIAASATGSFPNLMGDGRDYEIIAINYESSDAMIISDIQNLIGSPIAPLLTNTSPFDAYCFTTANTILSPDCMCCNISAAVVEVLDCNDEGTPADPSDDTFGFTLNVTQDISDLPNTGFVFDGSALGLTMSESGTYGPNGFSAMGILIEANSGTTVTITLVDADNPFCTFDVDIMIPLSCSGATCAISPQDAINITCNDNGTPADPSDDTFTFDVVVNGSSSFPNASNTFIDDQGNTVPNAYGSTVSYGPFPIGEGAVDIVFTDADEASCIAMITVAPPATCSGATCEITPGNAVNISCNDNGTPDDPSDDTFTFDVEVNGSSSFPNASNTFIDNQGNMVPIAYGSTVNYGPFPIGAGAVDIVFTDADEASCTAMITVAPPATCSGATCEITPENAINITCNDNETPSDPSDDTFTFDVIVNGSSSFPNASNSFTDDQGNTIPNVYGSTVSYGPFPIGAGAVDIVFTDADESSCTAMITVTPPATCSGATCEISPEDAINITCNDNGTPADPSDDTFTFDVMVNGSSSFPNASNTFIDNQGSTVPIAYGSTVSYGPFPIASGNVTITYTDADESSCQATLEVIPPATCSDFMCTDIVVDATTVCEGTDGTYSIVINAITGGDNMSGGYVVTIDGNDFMYPVDFPLTGQMYSGGDQSSIQLEIADADNASCTTNYEVFELNCVEQTMCDCALDGPLSINVQASAEANGHSLVYVLLDPSGTVVSVNGSGSFGGLVGDGSNYTVIAVNYEDADVAILGDINSLILNANTADELLMMLGTFSDYCYDVMTVDIAEECDCGSCSIDPNDAFNILCIDGGTPGDPSDDTFTFSVLVDGSNTTDGGFNMFSDDFGNVGSYGAIIDYGPFEIASGSIQITYTDENDPDCTTTITVEPPATCSSATCEFTPIGLSIAVCDDNGTPSDPSDDTFTFDLNVNIMSTFPGGSQTYSDDQGNSGIPYGTNQSYGPFPIVGGSVEIMIVDDDEPSCTTIITVNPPETCSDVVDCMSFDGTGEELCAIIEADPNSPLATLDCDGGGIDNATECLANTDPTDPEDDCEAAIAQMVDICALIITDPMGPLGTSDCDGGGVPNNVECFGSDGDPSTPHDGIPSDPIVEGDDCDAFIDNGDGLCVFIENNPSSTIATVDCDGGGVNNEDECQVGTNPSFAADDELCTDILIDATTECAADGTYTIVINSIVGGDVVMGDYIVTIEGTDFNYPADFPLMGRTYSGGDQGKIQIEITDADNEDCNTSYLLFELNCVDTEVCECANAPNSLTINAQASANANGFDLVYILSDGTNLTINQSGSFPNINGTGIGYTVYAVHVESADIAIILNMTIDDLDDLIATTGIFESACYDLMSEDFVGDCNCAVCSFDNVIITPLCDGSIEGFYDLEICFEITSPDTEDFIVTIDGVNFGPFLFSSLDADNCFVISGQDLMMVGDEETDIEVIIGQSILSNISPFISEIHYDNNGTDENEGVELTAPQGFDFTGYSLVLYDGGDGEVQRTIDLTGIAVGETCGALFFPINAIQNGGADGIAFVDPNGIVLEFLSYEGTLTALDGPAIGMTSMDIGVSESSTTDALESLQLTDFGWVGPLPATPNEINAGLSCTVQDPTCLTTEDYDEISCFDPCLFVVEPIVNDTIQFCAGDNVFIPVQSGSSFSPTDATNLFFSEYIEGTGPNRCLEIFNGTGMPINLDGWSIDIYSNGNTTSTNTALPNMTIADNDVFVICDPDASSFALTVTDFTSASATNYTGNDDIVLVDPNGVPVDILGTVGSAIDFGTDRSFIRDCSVIEGNPDVSLTFIPADFGWNDGGLNDFSLLGDHNYCGVAEIPNDCTFDVFLEDPTTGAEAILTGLEDGFSVEELGDVSDNQIVYIVCVTPEGCISAPRPVRLSIQNLGTIACEDVIQVSLGTSCEFEVTGDLLLSDDRSIDFYDLELVSEFGDILTSNVVTDRYDGQTLQYQLTDLCSGVSCWGELKIEVKFKPFLTSPCSFIPGYTESFTGELSNGENEVATFETIDECQTVNIDIATDLTYNCGTADNIDWCDGTYTVNINFFDILVFTDSGLSGPTSIQLSDLDRVGDYDIEIIPEQTNVEGTYAIDIVVAPCDPAIECIFTCAVNGPLDSIFFSNLTQPNNGFITLSEASFMLAESCFQPVVELRETVEESGDICDGGIRREVVYDGTIINKDGEREKLEILRQVYREVQTPFSSIVKPHDLELECEAPNDPQSIFDQFFIPNNSLADSIAISNAFPYVFLLTPENERIGRSVEVEVPVLVHFLQRIDTIKVERVINGELLLVDLIQEELMDSIRIDTVRRFVTILKPFMPDNPMCGYGLSYEDVGIPKCGNEVLTLRTWTFLDWCTQDIRQLPAQRIINVDSGPSIQDSLIDQTVSIDPFSCAATFELPDITALDDCGTPDGLTLEWSTDEGTIVDGFVINLWEDNSPVTLIATVTDECGNSSKDTMRLVIEDLIAPTAVCLDDIQVGITTGGLVFVDAVNFDNGSNDFGCGDVWVKAIRREDLRGTSNGFWNDNGPNRQVQYSTVPDANFTSRFTCNNAEADDFRALFRDINNNIIGVEIGTQVFFDDQVAFCCEEIGSDELYVMVRVFDVDPGPGAVDPRRMEREPTGPIFVRRGGSLVLSTNSVDNDLFGHFTDCWVRINLTDKIDPIITCSNYDLTCLDDLSTIPTPQAIGGVCTQSRVELLDETSLPNTCSTGDIIRQWFIDTDDSGDFSDGDPFCVQQITINENSGQFDPLTIKWPKHNDGSVLPGINLECDDDGELVSLEADIPMGDPVNCIPSFDLEGSIAIWCDPMCALVGYSIDVDTVEIADACLSLIRRHTVIDWCVWDPNGDNEEIDDDVFVAREDWAQGDCLLCESGLTRIAGGEEQIYLAYETVDVDGFYSYDQLLKVVDTTDPDILTQDTFTVRIVNEIGKEDEQHCSSSDIISAVAEDLCGISVTTSTLLSWEVTVRDESGMVLLELSELTDTLQFMSPEGSDNQVYTVDWQVSDGCGNSVSTQSVIVFEDMLAPTPVCVSGVSTAFIQEENEVTIWAKDFDLGSFDACSDVRFSIVGAGSDPIGPSNEFFVQQQSITISCEEFTQIADFDVWVWDESGNGAFCTVRVTVNDDCEEEVDLSGSSLITGFILTELGEGVDLAEVSINTDLPEYPLTSVTNVNGAYSFINNPLGRDYEIHANRDGDFVNGVSTSDLLGIQRHILGQRLFDSPYKTIAADVNNDANVTTVDIIILRNVILGLNRRFPNNTSWRFVDADFTFSNELSPWPFVEEIDIDRFSDALADQNFVAVKIGDVNNNALPNGLSNPEIRSSESLDLTITDSFVDANEIIEVPVSINDLNGFNGFQTTIEHADLELIDIVDGVLGINEANYGLHDSKTTISFIQEEEIVNKEVLFILRFKSKSSGLLSEKLSLSSSITRSESYQLNSDTAASVSLTFDEESSNIILFQNKPNPFSESTSIRFSSPFEEQVTMSIYSVTGDLVYSKQLISQIGENTVLINKTDLPSQGVYYYEVSTEKENHFKKLLLID